MTRVYNRTSEKEKRRALRGDMPRAEVLLWSKLRDRQLDGLKFRRQYSVGPYLIDFYCPEAKLAIEVDGDSHYGREVEERDARRQTHIGHSELGLCAARTRMSMTTSKAFWRRSSA